MEHNYLIELSLMIFLGLGAQWLAWLIRCPAIVLWMVAGLVFGGYLHWLNPEQTFGAFFHPTVEIASAIILFEGGMSLRYFEFRKIGVGLQRLVSFGLISHWILIAAAAHYVAGLDRGISALLASILVVTGPTVIKPILLQSRLRKQPANYIKWEGILNDPVGALMAVIVFGYLTSQGQAPFWDSVFGMLNAILLAVVLALGVAYGLGLVFRKGWAPDYLKVPAILGLVVLCYTVTNYLQAGGGLLTVTLLGVFLGNQDLPATEEIRSFKESFSTFLVSVLFVSLSATLSFDQLTHLRWPILAFIFLLLFVLRPASVYVSTIRSPMTWQERTLVAFFAPRGIVAASVAAVLGHQLISRNYPGAELVMPVVFIIVFISVFFYGFTFRLLTRWLQLGGRETGGVILVGETEWLVDMARILLDHGINAMVSTRSHRQARWARRQGVPAHFGDILSDFEKDKLDLADYSRLLAATESTSYNALVCQKLSTLLGSHHVYQLPFSRQERREPDTLPQSSRGRLLSDENLTYQNISEAYDKGARFMTQKVSRSADVAELQAKDKWLKIHPVAAIGPGSDLTFFSMDVKPTLVPGQSVLGFLADSRHQAVKI